MRNYDPNQMAFDVVYARKLGYFQEIMLQTMMKKPKFLLASAFVVALSGAAMAQTSVKVQQIKAWGTYTYNSASGKVCYVLSKPLQKEPSNLDHGDVYFLVSQKPGENVSFEPQFIAGYTFQDNSKINVTIGSNNYSFFTSGKSAWLENAALETQLNSAMKAGSNMSISAVSRRGNPTSYTFSLSGITAALDSIRSCK